MKMTLKLHDWLKRMLWTAAIAFLPAAAVSGADLVIGDTPGEVFRVNAGTSFSHTGDIFIVGTGSLLVNGTLNLTGTVYVGGSGNFTVDGGQFHLMGDYTNIVGYQNGRIIFRNDALLHYDQTYVGQHNIICGEDARVELSNSRVSADGSSESIVMGGNSSYHAVNMICPDWKTWYLSGQTSLTLENVNIGGDIVFYDSPSMRFVDTVGIMPWQWLSIWIDLTRSSPAKSRASGAVPGLRQDRTARLSSIPTCWKSRRRARPGGKPCGVRQVWSRKGFSGCGKPPACRAAGTVCGLRYTWTAMRAPPTRPMNIRRKRPFCSRHGEVGAVAAAEPVSFPLFSNCPTV